MSKWEVCSLECRSGRCAAQNVEVGGVSLGMRNGRCVAQNEKWPRMKNGQLVAVLAKTPSQAFRPKVL
jgi:hypothetical protein